MSYFEQILILLGAMFILAPLGVFLGSRLIDNWNKK
jgi:hypothetical protein